MLFQPSLNIVCFCMLFFVKKKKSNKTLFLEKEQGKSYYVLPVGLINSMVHKRDADCKKDLPFQW